MHGLDHFAQGVRWNECKKSVFLLAVGVSSSQSAWVVNDRALVGGRVRIRERCLEGWKFHVDDGPCFDLIGKRHPMRLVFAPAFEGP